MIICRCSQDLEFAGEPSGSIAHWAVDSIRGSVANVIIDGYDDDAFAPKDTSARSRMAAVIVRFIESVLPRWPRRGP